MTAEKKWTVNAIKDAMRAAGSHWFDPDTMRCFGTRVLPTVYQGPGGIYFVTEDDQYNRELPKRYNVRKFTPETADIDTVGEMNAHTTRADAIAAASEASGLTGTAADFGTTTEAFEPVSVLEQFVDDLRKHGNPNVTKGTAKQLMNNAIHHHNLAEQQCNGAGAFAHWDGESESPYEETRARILKLAKKVGAIGVVFSGDPRGCTVKLTFKDGFTNDWGNEGYCVPTGEDD